MREQGGFEPHAQFMGKLADERVILAGGPLGDEDDAPRVLHIMQAESKADIEVTLAQDPWGQDMLRTASIEPFTVLLGGFGSAR
jgi:uncharacterized protein YciI